MQDNKNTLDMLFQVFTKCFKIQMTLTHIFSGLFQEMPPFLIIPQFCPLPVFIQSICPLLSAWPACAWNVFLKDEKCLFIQFSAGKMSNKRQMYFSLSATLQHLCSAQIHTQAHKPNPPSKCWWYYSPKDLSSQQGTFNCSIKKVEHTLEEEIILNEVRVGGSPPIKCTLHLNEFSVDALGGYLVI